MTLVVSRGSGGLGGVQGQGPDTAIKAQHGCLAKTDTGGNAVSLQCVENRARPPLKRGSLPNVNSMGDCDEAPQSEHRWSFPVTAFDIVAMVRSQDSGKFPLLGI